jgi:RNA polymerase sigma-70 factor, ECF subfamily
MGLVAAETNGRSQDTEALYREHGAAVAALCRSLLRDRGEAEDAAQQVFLSAHRALLNGAAPREPLAWLLVVARNECYARFRQRAATPVPTEEEPGGSAADASVHAQRAGELASVWDEVGQMPPAQREAFLLREIQGLSYGQLAAQLSLSPPSVRSLLLRARSRLRRRLRDVAAFGSTPWLQSLLRLAGVGGGGSPLSGATKAAAVGLGALVLVGGGDVPRPAHLTTTAPRHAASRHQAPARARHASAPTAFAAVSPGDRSLAGSSSGTAREGSRGDSSGSTSTRKSNDGGANVVSESGSDDGSGGTTTQVAQTQVAQTTDGHDSGTSSSDGGPDSTTTVTTATPDTSGSSDGSSGRDGGSLDGSDSSRDGSSSSFTTTIDGG